MAQNNESTASDYAVSDNAATNHAVNNNAVSNSVKSTDAHSGATNNSLVAFLGAIKFSKPSHAANDVDRYFAQPQPQARQRRKLAEENYWIRSAN